MLIEMVDGGIKEIETDSWDSPGCETCDYGSSYVNDFTVYMVSGNIKVHIDQMYSYATSEGFLMRLFLKNAGAIKKMTEQSFYEWLQSEFKKETSDSWSSPDELTFDFIQHPISNNKDATRKLRRD